MRKALKIIALVAIGCIAFYAAFVKIPSFNHTAVYEHKVSANVQAAIDNCTIAQGIHNVVVTNNHSEGSGWWVKTELGDDYFITNAHVVLKNSPETSEIRLLFDYGDALKPYLEEDITLINEDGLFALAEVVSIIYNPRFNTQTHTMSNTLTVNNFLDVAVLKVTFHQKGFYEGVSQLALSESNKDEMGAIVGYRPNVVSMMTPYKKCLPMITDDEINVLLSTKNSAIGGQSGSAVLNQNGKVVSMLTASSDLEDSHLNVDYVSNQIHFGIYSNKSNRTIYALATPVKWINRALHMAEMHKLEQEIVVLGGTVPTGATPQTPQTPATPTTP